MQDPYKILGISRGASQDEARQAYRSLARACHPDVTGDPATAERFCRVTDAYRQVCEGGVVTTDYSVRVTYSRPRPAPITPVYQGSARRPVTESWWSRWRRAKRHDSIEEEMDELISLMIKLSR